MKEPCCTYKHRKGIWKKHCMVPLFLNFCTR